MAWNQQPEDFLDEDDYQLFLAQNVDPEEQRQIEATILQRQLQQPQQPQQVAAPSPPAALPRQPAPRQPLTEEEKRRQQELREQYRRYWYSIYGVEPTLAPAPKAFRERELARGGGPEAIRQRRQAELQQRIAEKPKITPGAKAARTIQRTYRQYHQQPCENQELLQAKRIHPSQTIKFKVIDDGQNSHVLCYDVIELHTYLVNTFQSQQKWREPTYNAQLTPIQQQLLEDRFRLLTGCGDDTRYYQLIAYASDDNNVLVPRELYDRALHHEGAQYVIYRLTEPETRFYIYIVADGYHDQDPNTIYLPANTLISLNLNDGAGVLIEDCLDLPRVNYLLLQPEEAAWYQIPDAAVDDIKAALTKALENVYVVQMGQQIPIDYGDKTYTLSIVDIKTGKAPGRRIPAGVTKFTEVALEIVPQK